MALVEGTLDDDFVHQLGDGAPIPVFEVENTGITSGDDNVFTLAGNDTIYAQGGADFIHSDVGTDSLFGGDGNDRLEGGAGADVLDGGNGVDTAEYGKSLAVSVDLLNNIGTGDEAQGDTFFQVENIAGSKFGDSLVGDTQANRLVGRGGIDHLTGGAGNDVLKGGAGADDMIGGTGDDTYEVDNAGDQITEARGGGTDTVSARVSYTVQAGQDIDVLRASGPGASSGIALTGNDLSTKIYGGSGADTLTGGAARDVLEGKAGDDVLAGGGGRDTIDGGAGADEMSGGTGDDVFKVDDPSDLVNEATGEGFDTVLAKASWVLAPNQEVEVIRAAALGLQLRGNNFANTIIGSATDDDLWGAGGNDVFTGGGGANNYNYFVGDGNDQYTDFNGAAGDRVSLTLVSVNVLNGNVATLSDGSTLTAQAGYTWSLTDFA